jgi:hypothetical protein
LVWKHWWYTDDGQFYHCKCNKVIKMKYFVRKMTASVHTHIF